MKETQTYTTLTPTQVYWIRVSCFAGQSEIFLHLYYAPLILSTSSR